MNLEFCVNKSNKNVSTWMPCIQQRLMMRLFCLLVALGRVQVWCNRIIVERYLVLLNSGPSLICAIFVPLFFVVVVVSSLFFNQNLFHISILYIYTLNSFFFFVYLFACLSACLKTSGKVDEVLSFDFS